MFIVVPVTAAVVLVFFGYIVLWSASRAEVKEGISKFGKVLAVILFTLAGFVLISGIAGRRLGGSPMPFGHGVDHAGPGFMQGEMPPPPPSQEGMKPAQGNDRKPGMQPPGGNEKVQADMKKDEVKNPK